MIWEGNFYYYLLLYVSPEVFTYLELLICNFLLFSECCKIFLLLKLEHVNLPHIIYKTKVRVWRKLEVGALTVILFLQIQKMNIFTPVFLFILGYEYFKKDTVDLDVSLADNIQYKRIELFVKFIFYLMTVYFYVVSILIKSN